MHGWKKGYGFTSNLDRHICESKDGRWGGIRDVVYGESDRWKFPSKDNATWIPDGKGRPPQQIGGSHIIKNKPRPSLNDAFLPQCCRDTFDK